VADPQSRSGTTYASAELLGFVDQLHAGHDEALENAFQAPHEAGMPPIQVGRSEGKFLELLVGLSGARKVVEIGTLAGYSTIRLARGLPDDGRVWTIELDPKHADVARQSIDGAGLSTKVEVLVGDAREVLANLASEGPFDLVFVDADKANYPHYGQWAAENLRPGGLLVGDNAFLFGQLVDDTSLADNMRRFHRDAAAVMDTVCLPTPDGLLLGIKRP